MPIPAPSPTLTEAIRHNNAVLVVGSGLSIPSGAPTWSALLEGIAAEAWRTAPHDARRIATALAESDRGRSTASAAILKAILGAEFVNVVARQFEMRENVQRHPAGLAAALAGDSGAQLFFAGRAARRRLRPTANHRMLMKLPWRAIVTTNYDRLLEDVAPRLPSLSWSNDSVSALIQRRDPFILKLHGDVVHRKDIVLAREDYRGVVNHRRVRSDLHALFAGGTALWIGYGHSDADLDLSLDELVEVTGGNGGFAVARLADRVVLESRFTASNVSPVWLDDFNDLPEFVKALTNATGLATPPRTRSSRSAPSARVLPLAAKRSTSSPHSTTMTSDIAPVPPPASPLSDAPTRLTITHVTVRDFVVLLAEFYGTSGVRRVCHDAGIPTLSFETNGSPLDVWERAVSEALNTARLDALLHVSVREYGRNPDLLRVVRSLRAPPT